VDSKAEYSALSSGYQSICQLINSVTTRFGDRAGRFGERLGRFGNTIGWFGDNYTDLVTIKTTRQENHKILHSLTANNATAAYPSMLY